MPSRWGFFRKSTNWSLNVLTTAALDRVRRNQGWAEVLGDGAHADAEQRQRQGEVREVREEHHREEAHQQEFVERQREAGREDGDGEAGARGHGVAGNTEARGSPGAGASAGGSGRIRARNTAVRGDTNGAFKVDGELTIRGTTRPVTLDVELTGSGKDPWHPHRPHRVRPELEPGPRARRRARRRAGGDRDRGPGRRVTGSIGV